MHPALSVIFFSTLSGAGYGLWFWWASSLLGHDRDFGIRDYMALAIGALFVTAGLLSSTLFARIVTPMMYKLLPPAIGVRGTPARSAITQA